jgi:signal peptidase I
MADDNIQRPPETFHSSPPARADHVTTAAPPPGSRGGDGLPAANPPTHRGEVMAPRSEAEQFLRWGAGLVLVLGMGWGLIFLAAYFAYSGRIPLSPEVAALLAAALSFGFFALAERNLWLSRFMGLRTAPGTSPLREAFFLWLLGVPGLLWRSTEGRDAAPADQKTQSEVSNTREVIETVVFVVVLVLLLKSFVAEAFVIPTGSMATTLYGYQKDVKCPKCGFEFPVNCSQEVDPQEGERLIITGCTCPNCRLPIELAKEERVEVRDPHNNQRALRTQWVPTLKAETGDRVLVGKFLYDLPWNSPEKHRLNVVVFKYPERPQKDYTPMNYIKRLIGLPGETIGIYYGKIFVLSPDKGLRYDDSAVPETDRWQYRYMHVDDPRAHDRWDKGEFGILRNPPEVVLAKRRIVYDNSHPASDLKDSPRWTDRSGARVWAADDSAHTFKHAAATTGPLDWLRYRHLIVRNGRDRPELITDFMGYNSYATEPMQQAQQPQHWVGDLMIECDVTIDKPQGQLVLELSRGSQRFRAVFDLASGECTLRQIKDWRDRDHKEAPSDDAGEVLATKPTDLKKAGTYHLRFANVDDRLLLWVDKSLPFGDGVAYTAAADRGPEAVNDLEPASIGVSGAGVTVGKLQLWRDTYYTQMSDRRDRGAEDEYPSGIDFADPSSWGGLHNMGVRTLYVQPGHYLCMGDNSPHSSDGRSWGTVPERLMLGRALVVYYPFPPLGEKRIGPIH